MLRKTLVSIAVSSALFVSSSYALELGELTSQSKISEPYRGKIELSDVGALTQNDILIRLGSESEFRQAGFSPTRVLSQLKFSVVRENGELSVRVSSDEALNVEELRFILAARWPSGQMVREYKAPLDQSALVEKSESDVVQSTAMSKGSASSGSVLRDSIAPKASMARPETLAVSKGNTLWSIADKNRPSNELSIYQTMMAIQSLNKDAFYSNNINLLKEGVVLRLPSQEQIEKFNKITSREEFLRQHDAWMALKGNKGSSVDRAQLNTQAKSKAASSNTGKAEDKLTLASGQSMLAENSGSSNAGNGEAAKLAMELSASQEMLDKEKREKEELAEKLGELNEQLETLEQLISLKDAQMAELQQQFTSAVQALQEQKNTVDQLLEADQIRREKEQAEADSLVNKIFGNPIIVSIGAAVLLMLGFLIGLIMRRSGKKKDQEDSVNQDEFDLSAAAPAAAVAAVASQPDEDEYDLDDDVVDDLDDFDSDVISDDEPEDMAISEEADFDSGFDDVELEDDEFSEDDLPEPVIEIDEDDLEDFSEEEIPTMMAEVEDSEEESIPDVDDAIDEAIAEIDEAIDSIEESVEPELEPVEEQEDIDPFEEQDAADELADVDELDLNLEEALEDDITSEEESFVSSLLDDPDQDDTDESAIFDGVPDDSVENTIEETLAEMQEEEEVEAPEFGEAEAAEDEEESDEEEEFDFFDASGDEIATKLDLARAYMDMGDEEGARVILEDVVEVGNEAQIAEAKSMMERLFPSD
ncbi:pilus assembly protein FimV [Marinomonas sp. C2222]|uniref:Pilus assembly protein FimV n=1 Tax=Marinomonas sargassi TaxID=2984494 RepID=A0ABT2YSG1_9GAMM|nr:FimV/HubP family polar landmark protein [Marinomonas sargassi]MCV2402842.1 pilus assembly protein FimV [Marinomonas sargassi]